MNCAECLKTRDHCKWRDQLCGYCVHLIEVNKWTVFGTYIGRWWHCELFIDRPKCYFCKMFKEFTNRDKKIKKIKI